MVTKPYPLRTALIGLSSTAATSWAASAHLPGLLSEEGQTRFSIKALLNSSTEAAEAAIKTYRLPSDTKAYGSPEDLAADPDIDLVICNTRVDKHYEVVIQSVRAGKDVFVEWPIATTREQIQELINAAKQSGSRVAVGLQRRWNPIALKIRELLHGSDAKLGKVLSVEVRMFGGTIDRETLPMSLKYFAKNEIGGNVIVIGVGHKLSTIQAKTQIQHPNVGIRDPTTNEVFERIESNVPDLLSFNARLKSSSHTVENATLGFFFRRGQPFPGTSSLTWTINCQHGEIRVDSPSTAFFEASEHHKPITIHVHHFHDDSLEKVDWSWSPEQLALPLQARSVSATLLAFADDRPASDGWVDLEDAAERAVLIEKLLNAK